MRRRRKKYNNKGVKTLNIIIILLFIIFIGFLYENDAINLNFNSINSFKDSINNIGNSSNKVTNITTSTNGDLYVYFFNVGQADAILIVNGDDNMLIDAGNNEDGLLLVNYLKEMNITRFNYVFGTHAHEDHIGGLDDIINNFDIDNFYMPDVITATKTYEDVLDSLNNKNIKYRIPKVGDNYSIGRAVATVLSSDKNNKELNDSSIVLRLNYGNNCFLFMGDASNDIESKIIKDLNNCDLLKVGHHGSKYSTSEIFLGTIKPKYAVISVGKDNKYNHPNDETINLLNKKDIKIYRTDEKGTIVAKSDGKEISFTFKTTNIDG